MVKVGCRNCRRRHSKCVILEGASTCNKCADTGRRCQFAPRYRFKVVRHIYQKEGDARSRFILQWDKGQPWVEVSKPLHFVDGNSDISNEHGLDEEGHSGPLPSFFTHHHSSRNEDQSANNQASAGCGSFSGWSPSHAECQLTLGGHATRDSHTIVSGQADPIDNAQPSPTNTNPLHKVSSPVRTDYLGSPTSLDKVFPSPGFRPRDSAHSFLSPREAFLLRLFVQKMSPWLDISDAKCHFGNEVPRRALHEPMLLFALLAVASRHDSIMRGSGELESSTYHGQCLELLIPSLSRPEETYDGNLLVTVVLLRHYEELENQTDERRHFLGSTSLLNAVAKFSASGGLVEATSWLFLRQAIYVSLVLHEPLELRLENYELSDAFRLRDDGSYTNVIVFLFAKILRYIYNGAEYSNSPEDWYFLQREIESWHDSKPASFTPLNHGEADPDSGKLFPEFWMLSSAAAVGMQYYYGAMLLLTIHKPLAQSAGGFEAAKVMRIAEVAAASYLADIIGIAISNDTTENAHFTASHFICSYGYCLSHEAQRKGAIDYLKRVKEIMGWNTCWIVEALKSQWSELDEFVKRPLKVT